MPLSCLKFLNVFLQETVKVFLKHPSVKDDSDLEGRTSFMWAAGKGNDDVLRTMLSLKSDIDINMADKYGFILEMFTTSEGSINVPLMIDAVKSEIKARGGLKIWNIKITENDFEEILNTYCELQKRND